MLPPWIVEKILKEEKEKNNDKNLQKYLYIEDLLVEKEKKEDINKKIILELY